MTGLAIIAAALVGAFCGFVLGAIAHDRAGRSSREGWLSPCEAEHLRGEVRILSARLHRATSHLRTAIDAADKSSPA